MSTALFPSLPGQTWPIKRTAIWQTRTHNSVSGKKLNIADWSTPKWQWDITWSAVRGYNATLLAAEIQALQGFFNSRQGSFGAFLYGDTNDFSATQSTLGSGDSTNRSFAFSRYLGTFSESLLAPLAVSSVTVGSSNQSSTKWSFTSWEVSGTTAPGFLTFSTFAPPAGQAVVASFTYAWPVSFDNDTMTYEEFVRKIWGTGASFTQLK